MNKKLNLNSLLGIQGENITIQYLEDKKFNIITKNYRVKYGEIDIIAQKENLIVFVEVKLRNNPKFFLSDLISFSKQKKIIKTALNFTLKNINSENNILRFDVALVEIIDNKINLNYIENAFTKPE